MRSKSPFISAYLSLTLCTFKKRVELGLLFTSSQEKLPSTNNLYLHITLIGKYDLVG